MHRCERCGESNSADASYCATCGLALADPSGVAALVGEPTADGGPSSESVAPPAFGETTMPRGPAPSDEPPPTAPAAGGGATTDFPANAGPPPGPTEVIAPVPVGGEPVGPSPASESRSTGVMVAALAISIVVIVGGLFVLLASNSGDDAVIDDDTDVTDVTDGPEPTIDSAPSSAVVDNETASSVDDVVLDPTTTVVESTVPPTEPQPTIPTEPSRAAGDLGLQQPILDEACDGRYITFVGSAVGAQPYADEVDSLLAQYPGSNYIWTRACPSLRQEFRDGNDIYGVVFGPYLTQQEACDAVAFGPPDAYVRRISTTDPEDHTVDC